MDIFISYRRKGGRDLARLIYEKLSITGYNTFFDYNSMRNGRFNDQIFRAIEEATDFILVLSDGALERCDNEDDWVRIEIEYALGLGKNIIPIVRDEKFEFPDNLPPSLSAIKGLQWVVVPDEYFDEGISRLESFLHNKGKKVHKTWKPKLIIAAIILIGLLGIFLLSFPVSTQSKVQDEATDTLKSCYSQLFLKRYKDVTVDLDINKDEFDNKGFAYKADIVNNVYRIRPFVDGKPLEAEDDGTTYYVADTMSLHHPVVGLKFHNKEKNTIVVNSIKFKFISYKTDHSNYSSSGRITPSQMEQFVQTRKNIEEDPNYFYVKVTEKDIRRGYIQLGEESTRELQRGVVDDKVSLIFDFPESCFVTFLLDSQDAYGRYIVSDPVDIHFIKDPQDIYYPL